MLAGVGSLILQSVGQSHGLPARGDTYGTFALVIGLLSWFWLGSHLLLLAAAVNVVLRPSPRRALRSPMPRR